MSLGGASKHFLLTSGELPEEVVMLGLKLGQQTWRLDETS